MKSLIAAMTALLFALPAFAQVCAPDMADIRTTDNAVLRAAGHGEDGYNGGRLGDPNSDSQNWLNGTYNNFLTPQAEGHFFYNQTIFPPGVPFMGDEDEIEFGMCSSQGQCVQATFQVEFNRIPIGGALRAFLGRRGFIIPVLGSLPTTPKAANVGYTAPNGNQFSKRVVASNGKMPTSQPTTPKTSGNGGCLDNNAMFVNIVIDIDGPNEDDEENEDEEESNGDDDDGGYDFGGGGGGRRGSSEVIDPDENGDFPEWEREL